MAQPNPNRAVSIARLLGLHPASPSRMRAMLAARRAMVDAPYKAKFDGVDMPDGGWIPTRQRLEPNPVARDGRELGFAEEAFLRHRARKILGEDAWIAGVYDPNHRLVVYPAAGDTASRGLRRHEVMHGYNHAARQGAPGMPLASRAIAQLPSWLSRPLDEISASRAGGTGALEIPWHLYAARYLAEGNVGAARVARGLAATQRGVQAVDRVADFASDHPVLFGGGVFGSALLGRALSLEDSE